MKPIIFWHRRDLRISDNHGLFEAAKRGPVQPVFIFDSEILKVLPPDDKRVSFIYESITELAAAYKKRGTTLMVQYGNPTELIPKIASELNAYGVVANRDYELYATQRDQSVEQTLAQEGRKFATVKDHIIYEDHEVLTLSGGRFSVFTPYKNAWIKKWISEKIDPFVLPATIRWNNTSPAPIPTLSSMGFTEQKLAPLCYLTGTLGAQKTLGDFLLKIANYHNDRNPPAIAGTSKLGVHLRFGTIGPRELLKEIDAVAPSDGKDIWISEIIWRDFYSALLQRKPSMAKGNNYQPQYDVFTWDKSPTLLQKWQAAETGYPIVDAGIKELIATGFMHNRVRMICASFLCKHLLLNWTEGEAFFAKHLMDYDAASNIGGWQWAASTGSDAQPYFRIFNPTLQSEKFDKQGEYIKKWLPQLNKIPAKYIHAPHLLPVELQQSIGFNVGQSYPLPIVVHEDARKKALTSFTSFNK